MFYDEVEMRTILYAQNTVFVECDGRDHGNKGCGRSKDKEWWKTFKLLYLF